MSIYHLFETVDVNMHYLNRYVKLITFAQSIPHHGYTEKHHILPKSMGGSNDTENIVKLSARQHFLAHWILWKACRNKEMTAAFRIMYHVHGTTRGRVYQELKEAYNHQWSGENSPNYGKKWTDEQRIRMSGENHPNYGTKWSPERLVKLSGENHYYFGKSRPEHSARMSGEGNPMHGVKLEGDKNGFYGKKHSEECKQNSRERLLGKTWDELFGVEAAAKLKSNRSIAITGENNPFYGKTHSEETKDKIRMTKIGKKAHENTIIANSERLKGKTWEEIFGAEKAAEMREKQSARFSGKNNPSCKNKKPKEELAKYKKVECPRCGRITGIPNAKKRHFDNCIFSN